MQNTSTPLQANGLQAAILQVGKSTVGQHTIIQQNGQNLIIGKIVPSSDAVEQNTSECNQPEAITIQSGTPSVQTVYPIQYIDATGDNSLYNVNRSNGQIFYQDSGTLYTAASVNGSTNIFPSSYQGGTSLLVNQGGTTYVKLAGGAVGQVTDISDATVSHTTKASPVTVQWLIDNYETADGVSLPRSTLYNHYLQHCNHEKLEPMNQASFGKLIRSVFFGLRTRRLGTRGNSKYHYYGIRIKPNSVLNHYVDDHSFSMRHYSYPRSNMDLDFHSRYKVEPRIHPPGAFPSNSSHLAMDTAEPSTAATISGIPHQPTHQHSQFLGETTSALPNCEDVMTKAGMDELGEKTEKLGNELTLDDISIFCKLYEDHNVDILNFVVYLNFNQIETIWHEFWRASSKPTEKLEARLSKEKLNRLLQLEEVQLFIQRYDNAFYQSLAEVLIPNVLRPIPSALTQTIRNFAKFLENWMRSATMELPDPVSHIKVSCVCALAQSLRRYTSLNHLAQAARAVLKNTSQISQMLADLNRVDFGNVQEQASWVCGCEDDRVKQLEHDFKRILQSQASLEDWASWLDEVVSEILQPYKEGGSGFRYAAHQFILKWSYYSSMVIRDLTLRSAASFGSFHLIRLLYDEYIYYLVEHKVADHLKMTPIAVMGDMGRTKAEEDNNLITKLALQGKSPGSSVGVGIPGLKISTKVMNSSGATVRPIHQSASGQTINIVSLSDSNQSGIASTKFAVNASGGFKAVVPGSAAIQNTVAALPQSTVRKSVCVTTFGERNQTSTSDAVNQLPNQQIAAITASPVTTQTSVSMVTPIVQLSSGGNKRIKLITSTSSASAVIVTSVATAEHSRPSSSS